MHSSSSPDYFFISLTILLAIFGAVMLSSASSDLALARFGDSYYYLNHQILYGISIGVLGFFLGSFFYYRHLQKFATLLLIGTIVLLILVFSPLGFATKGSSRWLNIAGISVQPAELLKLTFIVYLSAWLSKSSKRSQSLMGGFLPFLFWIGAVSALLVLQPSTTTAIIIFFSSLVVYFMAGARFSFIAGSLMLASIALGTVVYFTPYRLQRVLTFFHPQADELGKSYHLNQALIAIGSGGLAGVGYGESTAKLKYLPEPIGDSIFAVIAEELGFIGSGFLISIFILFIWRGFRIARRAPDSFGRLMTIGFVSLIGLQVFINIAAISGLIPLTGVPLPFISYGGTALAVFLTMSGIIVNVSKHRA